MKEILTERAELFDPNMVISFTFDIAYDGLKYIEVEHAVKKAFMSFEMTLSKITLSQTGQGFYEMLSKSSCTVQETFEDLNKILFENEKHTLDIEHGELMRIFIQMTIIGASVTILSHHLAGDGKSLTYFIERVMLELSGDKSRAKVFEAPTLSTNNLLKNSKLSVISKWYANNLNRKWNKTGKHYDFNDRQKLHDCYWKTRYSVVLREQLMTNEVIRLQEKAKSIGTTLNSLLLAAFMKFSFRYKGVGLAVSARANGDNTMSNQVTGISAKYTYNHKWTFERNVKTLHKRIYRQLKSDSRKYFIINFMSQLTPNLIDAALMASGGLCDNKVANKVARLLYYMPIENNANLSFTNLTKLDIQDVFGDYKIKNLCFIPPVVAYTYQTFGVATFNGVMSIALHSLSDRINEKEKMAFYETINFLKSI